MQSACRAARPWGRRVWLKRAPPRPGANWGDDGRALPESLSREAIQSVMTIKSMSNFSAEQVLGVHHWNDHLFSFRTTRGPGLRFANGQFVMMGLEVDGKALTRAYSIASPNYEEHLEFFSIKVPDGPLTSRLQYLREGDLVLVGKKPTGTLVIDDLRPGKHLYLFSTGTGLAPFMSLIQDPEVYERFEKVVLLHGVRYLSDLAYRDFITRTLPDNEFFGEAVRRKLIYYPTVTREAFPTQGRVTELVESGRLFDDTGLPPLDPAVDRAMICGSSDMLRDCRALLDKRGFSISRHIGDVADYAIERAFVDK